MNKPKVCADKLNLFSVCVFFFNNTQAPGKARTPGPQSPSPHLPPTVPALGAQCHQEPGQILIKVRCEGQAPTDRS